MFGRQLCCGPSVVTGLEAAGCISGSARRGLQQAGRQRRTATLVRAMEPRGSKQVMTAQQQATQRQEQHDSAIARAVASRFRAQQVGSPAVASSNTPSGRGVPGEDATGRFQQSAWTAANPYAGQDSFLSPGMLVAAQGRGMAPEEQLRAIAEAQRQSEEALQKIRTTTRRVLDSTDGTVRRLVDIRMYEQVAASRDRALLRLSEANAYVQWMEGAMEERQQQVEACQEMVAMLALEVSNISRVALNAAAAVRFSVSKDESEAKLTQVSERLKVLEQVMSRQIKGLDGLMPRTVPIRWTGLASDVRVMGSFDNWTHGVSLSAEDEARDGTLTTFEGTLQLPPGEYMIKFVVDGEWRLAGDWPTRQDSKTEEYNNLLVVE